MGRIVDISEVLLQLGLSDSATEEERAIAGTATKRAESAIRKYIGYDPVQERRTEFYPQRDYKRSGSQTVWEATDTGAYQRYLSEATTDELILRHIPIRSSPAIDLRIDYDGRSGTQTGAFAVDTRKVEGTDFWPNYDGEDDAGSSVCRDGLIRSIGLWPTEAGSVRIEYTAGYTDAELHGDDALVDAGDIVDAVIEEAVRRTKKGFVLAKQGIAGFVGGVIISENLGDYKYTIDPDSAKRLFGGTNSLLDSTKEMLEGYVHFGLQGL
jgi:hypothetical protein